MFPRSGRAVNQLLQPDGWELYQSSLISGRPVWRARRYSPLPIAPQQLRDAIAEAIAELKAYEIPAFCEDALGLANQEAHGDDPMSGERMAVSRAHQSALLPLLGCIRGSRCACENVPLIWGQLLDCRACLRSLRYTSMATRLAIVSPTGTSRP